MGRVISIVGLSVVLWVLLACPGAARGQDAAAKKLLAANGLFQRQFYKLAADQYVEFLKENPGHAEASTARYALAVCWYRMGEPAQAAGALETLLKEPGFKQPAEAMLVLGHCYLAGNDQGKALGAFERLLKEYPKAEQAELAALSRAQVLYRMGRRPEAIEACEVFLKAYATSPRQANALLLLGQALEGEGKAEAAVAQYRKVIALSPNSPQAGAARFQMGLSLLSSGKIAEARETLGQVVGADASRAVLGRYWLAQCDIAEKKFEPALKALEDLSRLQPPPAVERLTMDRGQCLLGLGRFAEAAEQFALFVAQHPNHEQAPEAIYRQAYCLQRAGQYEKSLAACEKLGDPPPKVLEGPARELRAESLFLLNRFAEAAKVFELVNASAQGPEQKRRIALRLGQCAYYAGDYAKAIELLRPLNDGRGNGEMARSALLLGDALLQTGRNREAMEVLAGYAALAGQDKPEAKFKLGVAQARANEAGAEATLAEVMGGDSPWAARAAFEYGQLLYRKNQPEKAGEALKRVVAGNVSELVGPARYLLAWIDLDAKRFAEAAEGFGQVAAKHAREPLGADAGFYRGVALKEGGKEEKAIEAFEAYLKAFAKGAHAAKARQMIASCLVKLERHEQALAALTALAAEQATASDEVLYDLAWSQQAMKKSQAAEQTYRRLLGQFPTSKLVPAARSELAEILFGRQAYAEATELLGKVIGDGSADAKTVGLALYRLGACYEKLGEPGKAAATYKDFLERHGDDELAAWAHYQAGVNLAKQEKLAEATEHFQRVLAGAAKAELQGLALLKLGETQAQAGEFEASEKTYRRFIEAHGQDRLLYQAQFGVGWALENQKKHEEARAWYEKVIAASNTPTAARAQFQIGETYFAQGKLEQAVASLLAVADVYGYPEWSARAVFEAGRVFEQMRQPEQARRQYEQVIGKYKDAPEAALAQKRLKALGG